MPTDYMKTLEYLYYFLKWINDEPEYEMNWKNLVICWAPSLTIHPQDASIQAVLNNSAQSTHAILVLFENFQQILSHETPATSSPPNNQKAEAQTAEEEKAQPRTIKIEIEQETERAKPKPHSKIEDEVSSPPPNKQKSILVEPEIAATPNAQQSKQTSADQTILLSPITPHNWRETLYKSALEDGANATKPEQNFEVFKHFTEKQLSKTKMKLQNMESYFISEFKNLWTRLDQIEEMVTNKKTQADSTVNQIKNQCEEMKNDNESFVKKVDDALKEMKYREVRIDWEMDYLKRTVDSFSNRLRENTLDLSSMKVRLDSRVPQPVMQSLIDETLRIPVPNPFASNQSSTLNSPSTSFSRYSKLSPTQVPKKLPEHYSIKYDKFISK